MLDIQPSRKQNENNPEPLPPKRPPKPPSYSSNDSPVKEYGVLPPVPPKKNSLNKINGDSEPPPVPKHMFHQTTMKHEDLHSRPPPLPPRSNSSDESLNDYAPPALPPKSSKFS